MLFLFQPHVFLLSRVFPADLHKYTANIAHRKQKRPVRLYWRGEESLLSIRRRLGR